MRGFLVLRALLASCLLTSVASADAPPTAPALVAPPERASPAPRPMKYVQAEVNPLGLLVNRVGGQLQIAIAGPVAVSLSAAQFSISDSQRYSEYDEAVNGGPSVRGWIYEVGPRFFAPVARAWHFWAQPSFIHQSLRQGGTLTTSGRYEGETTRGPEVDASRDGFAIDAGVQLTVSAFTLSLGLGHQWLPDLQEAKSSAIVPVPDVRREGKLPRLLFSIGFAY